MSFLLQTCSADPRTRENAFFESSPKKTCIVIIIDFVLSFTIYLVSLSLYTKLVCKVLFKRHSIFVVNISPTLFASLCSLEAPLYLTLQQLPMLDFKTTLPFFKLPVSQSCVLHAYGLWSFSAFLFQNILSRSCILFINYNKLYF